MNMFTLVNIRLSKDDTTWGCEDGFAYFSEDEDAVLREEDITNCIKTINTNDYNYSTDNNKTNNKIYKRKFQFLFCNPKISHTFVPWKYFQKHKFIRYENFNIYYNERWKQTMNF